MKKTITALATFALAFAVCVSPVFADGSTGGAKVDDEQGLVDAIADGMTEITLENDIVLDNSLKLYDLPETITINGNDHWLQGNGTGSVLDVLNSKVVLNKVSVSSNGNAKHAVNVFGPTAEVTISAATLAHYSAEGSALTLTNGAKASIGQSMVYTQTGWDCINIDVRDGYAPAHLAITGGLALQNDVAGHDLIKADKNTEARVPLAGYVTGLEKAGLSLAYGDDTKVAYTNPTVTNVCEFEYALAYTPNNGVITVDGNLKVPGGYDVTGEGRVLTLKGGSLTGNGSAVTRSNLSQNLLNVTYGATVNFENISLATVGNGRHVLNVYDAHVALNNVSLTHEGIEGAPMVLAAGASADVAGKFNVALGEDSWYAVNVDNTNGGSKINFDESVEATFDTSKNSDASIIKVEKDGKIDKDGIKDSVIGADNADLVLGDNGEFVETAPMLPIEPGQPVDPDENVPGDKVDPKPGTPGELPETGDIAGLISMAAAPVAALGVGLIAASKKRF